MYHPHQSNRISQISKSLHKLKEHKSTRNSETGNKVSFQRKHAPSTEDINFWKAIHAEGMKEHTEDRKKGRGRIRVADPSPGRV